MGGGSGAYGKIGGRFMGQGRCGGASAQIPHLHLNSYSKKDHLHGWT